MAAKKLFTQIFIYFSKPLRLLYSLIIYEIVNFSFFTLYSLLLLSFFLYLKSVPIYVIVHVHASVGRALCLEYRVSWVRVPPEAAHFSRKSDCLGCAVLLCLVCLTLLASFFLISHLKTCTLYSISFKHQSHATVSESKFCKYRLYTCNSSLACTSQIKLLGQ